MRYLGVDVGRVVRITLDQRAADRVQVIVDIDASAPISDRTLAQLSLQGVTGLLYIDLQQQRPGALPERLMEPVASEHYPVIRSIRSNFDIFLSSLPEVASRVGELAIRGEPHAVGREHRRLQPPGRQPRSRRRHACRRRRTMPQQLVAELRAATTAEARELIAKMQRRRRRRRDPTSRRR